MPNKVLPRSLYTLSTHQVSSLLLKGCQNNAMHYFNRTEKQNIHHVESLQKFPCRREDIQEYISPSNRMVSEWLSNLPDRVVEDVVKWFLTKLETHLVYDLDNNFIFTLIENMKTNNLFYSVHALLSVLQGFHLESIHFSKRLLFCLQRFSEITNCKHLSDSLCYTLPGFPHLTSLNISNVADDRVLYTVTSYLNNLVSLDMSNSSVTDLGIQLFSSTRYPTRNLIQKADDILEGPDSCQRCENLLKYKYDTGCPKLQYLNLQSCSNVTEKSILYLLEHLPHLKILEYHQDRSVFEILIRWSSSFANTERSGKVLSLREVEHYYPYSLCLSSEQVSNLSMLLPNLTTVTLVTTDSSLSMLGMFTSLSRITLELEDYLGTGFIDFLSVLGHRLMEINLSCNSEVKTDLQSEQLHGNAVQEGQLFNLGMMCVGLLATKVNKLSISGCGLVGSAAINTMGLQEKLSNHSWLRKQSSSWFLSLRSLIIVSHSTTIHSGLFNSVVTAAKNLEFLNLEGSFESFLTDSFFSSILSNNPLGSLVTLDICTSELGGREERIPLTTKTVGLVLASCKKIKNLIITDWSVSCAEFWKMQRLIRNDNCDILIRRRCTRINCSC